MKILKSIGMGMMLALSGCTKPAGSYKCKDAFSGVVTDAGFCKTVEVRDEGGEWHLSDCANGQTYTCAEVSQ